MVMAFQSVVMVANDLNKGALISVDIATLILEAKINTE